MGNKEKMPRVLLAAPKSGSGKTMLTCGILEALKQRGLRAASFKCGPDYIDPMFHRSVLGIASGNLDSFFTDSGTIRYLLGEKAGACDITVMEGVMGYYDGLGGQSEKASTYELAHITETPVVLIVDGKGASVSLAAVIKGMMDYRKDSRICGVILNRTSEVCYGRLKELIERECTVPVIGYMPQLDGMEAPSRHLGLAAPEEMQNFREWAAKLGRMTARTIDLDALLAIARKAEPCRGRRPDLPRLPGEVRLAVARDEAFSFYYEENLELLKRMGAKLLFFSPLHDGDLPEDIDGLLLGGGYPELYADRLEAASGVRNRIRTAIEGGMPCLAECGGFLYLQQSLEGTDGKVHNMAEAIPGEAFRTKRLCRFGYIEAEIRTPGVMGEKGQRIKGHEFHYWDSTHNGEDFLAVKPAGAEYSCMLHTSSCAAGFPHFYYYSNPGMIYQFLLACLSFRAARAAKRRWDSVAKPIDSLGLLEDSVTKLCRIAGSPEPYEIQKRALAIFCGDHGVVAEGVTQTGSEVTKIVSENFAKGCSTVNLMARRAGVDVFTIDIGMNTPAYACRELVQGKVIDRKVGRGCGNIAREPAMSPEQCRKAIQAGCEVAGGLKRQGYRILATGEMGIGNTTPTSAVAAILLGQTAEAVTGRGAGLSAEGYRKKVRAVERAVARVLDKGLNPVSQPFEILAEAGGYELAAMAGMFLGGVKYRIPVVIDGAISAVSALAAARMDRRVPAYALASHMPQEAAGRLALQALGLEAILHGRLCLGEGTGAVALFPLLDMATDVYRTMGSFTDYAITPYARYEEAGTATPPAGGKETGEEECCMS